MLATQQQPPSLEVVSVSKKSASTARNAFILPVLPKATLPPHTVTISWQIWQGYCTGKFCLIHAIALMLRGPFHLYR